MSRKFKMERVGLGVVLLLFSCTGTCLQSTETQSQAVEPVLCVVEEYEEDPGKTKWQELISMAEMMSMSRLQKVVNFSITSTVLTSEVAHTMQDVGCTTIDSKCALLIVLGKCQFLELMTGWASSHLIPQVLTPTTTQTCPASSRYALRLVRPRTLKIEAIQVLIEEELGWKDLVFIYDSSMDPDSVAELKIVLSDMKVAVTAIRIHEAKNITLDYIFHEIQSLNDVESFILVLHWMLATTLLSEADTRDMLEPNKEWLVLTEDDQVIRNLDPHVLHGSKVLFLHPKQVIEDERNTVCGPKQLTENSTVVEELAHQLSAAIEAILMTMVDIGLKNDKEAKTSVCDAKLYRSRQMILSLLHYRIPTPDGIISFDPESGRLSSIGYEFRSTDTQSTSGYTVTGDWSVGIGLRMRGRLFRNEFLNFGGKHLVIASQEAMPFVIKKERNNETTYEGFAIELLNELASRLKFTYHIVEPPDGLWGAPEADGTWNGIVGMVKRKQVAFGVGPLTITGIRQSVIDFTLPYMEDGLGILTKKPDLDSEAMFRLFRPLQPMVWAFLGGSIVIVSIVLYLVNRSSPFAARRYTRTGLDEMTLFTCLWTVLGSALDQGADVHPKSWSGRLILGFWWLFTIILISTYTANMAAVLTITIYEKPINSLVELASQSSIAPLVKTGTNAYTLFKEANNDVYREIWGKMQGRMPIVTTNQGALVYVRGGETAFMTDRSQLEYILLNDCETFALAEEVFNTGGMGFVVPKHSPFLSSFNLIIMKLQESGLMDRWRRKWWSNEGAKCPSGEARVSKKNQLDIQYIAGPFFIILGIMALSALIAVGEFLCSIQKWKSCCVNRLTRFRSRKSPETL